MLLFRIYALAFLLVVAVAHVLSCSVVADVCKFDLILFLVVIHVLVSFVVVCSCSCCLRCPCVWRYFCFKCCCYYYYC